MSAERPIHIPNSTSDSLRSAEKLAKPNLGFGEYLPRRILTNDEIASWKAVKSSKTGKPLSANDFTEKTGIESRRIAGPGESLLRMGLLAAQEAYQKLPGKIDAVIVTTNFPTGINISTEIAK